MDRQSRIEEAAIRLTGVTAGYGGVAVVHDISLAVARGHLVSLVGPNGAGKTTLLKVVAGLLRPLAGEVTVLGRRPADVRPRLAYVPQRGAVDWHFPLSVRQAVMMGRHGRIGLVRRPAPRDEAAVVAALERTGLRELQSRQIGRLSGGQQQRVFLARVLAQEAEILLLDEPFEGVDATTEEIVVETLERLREEGKTIVASTHDLARAQASFDQILLLNRHVKAYGPPSRVFTAEALRRTFGNRLVTLPEGHVVAVRQTEEGERVAAIGERGDRK